MITKALIVCLTLSLLTTETEAINGTECEDYGDQFKNCNILDTVKYSDWKILQGENQWFQYFNHSSEIPEDVEYNDELYHNGTVGFPFGFKKENFLEEIYYEGLWMMVHSNYPPNFNDPVAHIDFVGKPLKEYDTVTIICYLYGNSSLEFVSDSGEKYILVNNQEDKENQCVMNETSNLIIDDSFETFVLDNSEKPKDKWDILEINAENFKTFTINIYTSDCTSNSSFVLIEKVFVGKTDPTYGMTTTTETASSTEKAPSTSDGDKTSVTDPGSGSSTTEDGDTTNRGNSIFNSMSIMYVLHIMYSANAWLKY